MTEKDATKLDDAIAEIKTLNAEAIICVRIPDNATDEDEHRIRGQFKRALPNATFLMIRQLEIVNLRDVSDDLKTQIADLLLADTEFIEKLRMVLSDECQYRTTTTPCNCG